MYETQNKNIDGVFEQLSVDLFTISMNFFVVKESCEMNEKRKIKTSMGYLGS